MHHPGVHVGTAGGGGPGGRAGAMGWQERIWDESQGRGARRMQPRPPRSRASLARPTTATVPRRSAAAPSPQPTTTSPRQPFQPPPPPQTHTSMHTHAPPPRDKRVMLDCGIHPGFSGLGALPFLDEVELSSLDAALITHFHLDHCAAVPYLIGKTNFKARARARGRRWEQAGAPLQAGRVLAAERRAAWRRGQQRARGHERDRTPPRSRLLPPHPPTQDPPAPNPPSQSPIPPPAGPPADDAPHQGHLPHAAAGLCQGVRRLR